MIDKWQTEKLIAERWAEDTTRTIGLETLTHLAIHGFERCHYECSSRDVCGDYACACIRTLFPNERAYICYQELRQEYMQMEMLGYLYAAQETETNND